MTKPLPELIAEEIVSRLQGITIEDGYPFTVPSVDRVQRGAKDWTPRNLAIAVEQSDENENLQQSHPGNPPAAAYDVVYRLHAFVRPSDRTVPDTAQTTENAMVASIKQAITAAGHRWHTFGEVAIDARWGSTSRFVSAEGDHAGITMTLIVTYRASETDPYESRA